MIGNYNEPSFLREVPRARADEWKEAPLAEVGDTAEDLDITYGISDSDLPEHQGVVRIGDIRRGRVITDQPGRLGAAHPKDSWAVLQEGDLAVVLIRRVGDTALITAEHHGWIATRGIGIIRAKDPTIARWLRISLQTPRAQAWIDQHVTAHVEATLSLDALRRMPVSNPPPDQIDMFHELVGVFEAKAKLNLSIAARQCLMALAWDGGSITVLGRGLAWCVGMN